MVGMAFPTSAVPLKKGALESTYRARNRSRWDVRRTNERETNETERPYIPTPRLGLGSAASSTKPYGLLAAPFFGDPGGCILAGAMKVLVVDAFPESALGELHLLGLAVDYQPGAGHAAMMQSIRQAGILIVRSMTITDEVIAAATRLNLIIRAGAGVNTIDVGAASRRGIYVANCPGMNATAVAELTMGLILAMDRRIPDAVASLSARIWDKAQFSHARGLLGQAIGIAGLGAVGREVLARARAFGLVAHAWSRTLTPQKAQELGVVYASSLEQLATRADILTLHLPLTVATRHILNREVIEAMRDGAMLVNTARSELLDESALLDLAPKKKIRIAVDVFDGEPPMAQGTVTSPLLDLPHVYATPHIGASTEQAQSAIARETVRIVRSFLAEGTVPNVVNVIAASPARYQLVVRHLDRVGVLANVLSVIKRHRINVEELSNTVFEGAHAACAKIRLGGLPSEACLAEITAFEEVLHIDLVPLPNLA
jgi:D-3-phosphoglycerate dehydrogenase